MTTAINIENVSKKYIIRHQPQGSYLTLRDTITEKVASIRKGIIKAKERTHNSSEEFWALKDVSFEVKQGDRVGIIGRNGAGKSTLLKVLSRITEPTSGKIRMRGRVASLLEVGTGFHPELTGRENIFLNGAILGMTRAEIRKRFDEIVEFAEVEKFLDTPVKRYSSGMYVRLAFAVAAHLEPEILIVDEVLAVGDAQFQKKCLGKMKDVGTNGRTVLFVSHNMDAISNLCNRGIYLKSGMVEYQGEINKAISLYNGFGLNKASVENCTLRGGVGGIRVKNVWLTNEEGNKITIFKSNQRMIIDIEAQVSDEFQNGKNIDIGIGVNSSDGQRQFTSFASWDNQSIKTTQSKLVVACTLPYVPLVSQQYFITVGIVHHGVTLDHVEHCKSFEICQDQIEIVGGRNTDYHGFVKIPCEYSQLN
jgi:lipopolysaccharide transport system ATP-binding protein